MVPIPTNWVIDWRRFFQVIDGVQPNLTRPIDPQLVAPLHQLPAFVPPEPQSLAVRNLLRGARVGLPSGQAVAGARGVEVLTTAEISQDIDGAAASELGFLEQAPLWYYLLKEARVKQHGQRLGPLGSRIVSEVFVGLLQGDSRSFLSADPDWKPNLPSKLLRRSLSRTCFAMSTSSIRWDELGNTGEREE